MDPLFITVKASNKSMTIKLSNIRKIEIDKKSVLLFCDGIIDCKFSENPGLLEFLNSLIRDFRLNKDGE